MKIRTVVENIRHRFFAGIRTVLPEPQASLSMGFLVGLRALLPDDLLDNLSTTGLTHIVAVSGFNLTVLVRLARRVLAKHSKFIATAVAIGLIIGFMAMTGISPSIFRAAVVSGFNLAAWYWGRPVTAWMVLLLSAAITAGVNPTYIWQDIGWYLSFAAFFGVLILASAVTYRVYRDRQPDVLTQLVIETFCAQIMALPFIPFAMLLTFVAATAGMLVSELVGWFAWPADWVLTAMVWAVEWMAAEPG